MRTDTSFWRGLYFKLCSEVDQVLGKALKYPYYSDDQKNFPGTTPADGVCTGEHVPESLLDEAAKLIEAITKRDEEISNLKKSVEALTQVNKKLSTTLYPHLFDPIFPPLFGGAPSDYKDTVGGVTFSYGYPTIGSMLQDRYRTTGLKPLSFRYVDNTPCNAALEVKLQQLRWAIYELIENYDGDYGKTISGCLRQGVEKLFKEYTNS